MHGDVCVMRCNVGWLCGHVFLLSFFAVVVVFLVFFFRISEIIIVYCFLMLCIGYIVHDAKTIHHVNTLM